MYLKNTLYKTVIYTNHNKALFINGKFSVFWLKYVLIDSIKRLKNSIYFMHDGVLYKAENVFQGFSENDLGMIYQGKIMQVLNDYGYTCVPCKSIKEAFILAKKLRNRRANISLRLGSAELIHRRGADIIYASYDNSIIDAESITFDDGHYKYGTHDMLVDGYPDLDDSSICMNLMLGGARVEKIRELLVLFKHYEKTSLGRVLCKKQ